MEEKEHDKQKKSQRTNNFWSKINFFNREKNDKKITDEIKNRNDIIAKIIIYFFLTITLLFLSALIAFVIAESISAFKEFGFWNMLVGNRWAPTEKTPSFGILPFITATFWVCLFSMILAIPLGIFTSLFICEFLPKRLKKISLTFVELLSGIPSVVFGAFGLMVIGPIFVKMGAPTKQNMMTASFILALMALPTIISLSVNAINGVAKSYRYASLALGISQSKTTFKIVFKTAGTKIIGAVIFGFGRVIGETMAVIMIAGGSVFPPDVGNGPLAFFFSSITTLAGIIGIEINETTSALHNSALYGVGVFLFIIVTIINLIVLVIYKTHDHKLRKIYKNKHDKLKTLKLNETEMKNLITEKIISNRNLNKFFDCFRVFVMAFAWIITTGLILWIIGDVILEGIFNLHPRPGESIWNFHITKFFTITSDPLTGQGGYISLLATTFLLVFVAISLAMPIGIMIAVYLTEYNTTKAKGFGNFIRFFLNTLSSTPSIIFGMFGLMLFIDFLGFGFTIISAGLTLTIVVLPVIIKAVEDTLRAVPNEFREASLALGANKITTILKVVIPNALSGIIMSMILTMGRVIGESAPVYLTLGTTLQFPNKGFLSSGQTLTTHIIFLNKDSPLPNKINLMYETAFTTIVLIYILNFLAKYFSNKANKLSQSGDKKQWITVELLKSKISEKKSKMIEKKKSKPKNKVE
ncbi:MAG: phosphate ABC transporter permease subunit PstC [Spiroplasma sp.]|nr:phosphate ABC transporter permease subunit PstC [Spiroplasma sp.]